MVETDSNRVHFVQRYFQKGITDSHWHDLVINLGHVSRDEAVVLISTEAKRLAARQRGAETRVPDAARQI